MYVLHIWWRVSKRSVLCVRWYVKKWRFSSSCKYAICYLCKNYTTTWIVEWNSYSTVHWLLSKCTNHFLILRPSILFTFFSPDSQNSCIEFMCKIVQTFFEDVAIWMDFAFTIFQVISPQLAHKGFEGFDDAEIKV